MKVIMISRGVEISITGGVAETEDVTTVTNFIFILFLFYFYFYFLYHMFIVSTVQEMTCIFNDMAKTKPKIKSTINKGNKHNRFPQHDQ